LKSGEFGPFFSREILCVGQFDEISSIKETLDQSFFHIHYGAKVTSIPKQILT
jgi:hypothetical protein